MSYIFLTPSKSDIICGWPLYFGWMYDYFHAKTYFFEPCNSTSYIFQNIFKHILNLPFCIWKDHHTSSDPTCHHPKVKSCFRCIEIKLVAVAAYSFLFLSNRTTRLGEYIRTIYIITSTLKKIRYLKSEIQK